MMKSCVFSLCVLCLAIPAARSQQSHLAPPLRMPSAPPLTVHPAVTTGFTLQASPATVSLSPGGDSEEVTIVAFPQNGFTGTITVTAGAMPAGVTMTPSSFSLAGGAVRVVTLSASSAARVGTSSIHFTGAATGATGSASLSVKVQALANVSLTTTFFDFGSNFVKHSLVQTVAAVKNTGSATLTMSPVLTGDTSYSIVAKSSCGAQLAPGKTCDCCPGTIVSSLF